MRLRMLIYAVIILHVATSAARGHTIESDNTNSPALRLTASVTNITYCEGDREVYSVHLHLRLHYTNLGTHEIILYKPQRPIDITSAVIGATRDTLELNQYEATVEYDQFVTPRDLRYTTEPNPKDFAIVSSRGSYNLNGEIAVPVRLANAPISGTITAGPHVMRVKVTDWPFNVDSAQHLLRKWSNIGTLSYSAIESEPFEFSINLSPHLENCSIQIDSHH